MQVDCHRPMIQMAAKTEGTARFCALIALK
jgi:hypothetical protein